MNRRGWLASLAAMLGFGLTARPATAAPLNHSDAIYRQHLFYQQMLHQQWVERQMYRDSIGLYCEEMHNIAMLERQGHTYTTEQRLRIEILDRELALMEIDSCVTPEQLSMAREAYWGMRSTIVPKVI
jgi:hypothetical protein